MLKVHKVAPNIACVDTLTHSAGVRWCVQCVSMAVLVSLLWFTAIVAPLTYLAVRLMAGLLAYLSRVRTLMALPGMPPSNLLMGHVREVSWPTHYSDST